MGEMSRAAPESEKSRAISAIRCQTARWYTSGMSDAAPILSYDKLRVFGRITVTGGGERVCLAVRPDRRMAGLFLAGGIVAAAAGWLCVYLGGASSGLWRGAGMLSGYVAAIILFANAAARGIHRQRVEVTPKCITVSGAGSFSLLREEVVSVHVGVAPRSLSLPGPSVNASTRGGAEVAILLVCRAEAAFAAEILRQSLGLDSDPLNIGVFRKVSGRHVTVWVGARGAFGRMQSHLRWWAQLAIVLAITACVAVTTLYFGKTFEAVLFAIVAGTLGNGAIVWLMRSSPSIDGGVWDDEFLFGERCRWFGQQSRIELAPDAVREIAAIPASSRGRARLRITLSTGEEVMSERSWRADRLQALADTMNLALETWRKGAPQALDDTKKSEGEDP